MKLTAVLFSKGEHRALQLSAAGLISKAKANDELKNA
jgi:hypothetical protein